MKKSITVIQNNPTQNRENLEKLVARINNLLLNGQKIEMKNKFEFELTLTDTKTILSTNTEKLSNLTKDDSYSKIIKKLNEKLDDLEHKLSNLSLIVFCRSKAEKYLEQSRKDLEYINMVLYSIINNNSNLPVILEPAKQEKNYDDDISALNNEIHSLKNLLKSRVEEKKMESSPKLHVFEKQHTLSFAVTESIKPIPNTTIDNSELLLFNGMKHFYGIEGPINYIKAWEHLSKAVALKHASSMFLAGCMYRDGLYVEKSIKKALGMFKEASDLGNSNSTLQLAFHAEKKLVCESDKSLLNRDQISSPDNDMEPFDNIAFNYFKLAALEQKSSEGYYYLGLIFQTGSHNQSKDFKKCYEYFKKAAEIDGSSKAVNAIGNIYYNGDIVAQKDYSKAFEKFVYSGRCGNLDSINSLGICYENGHGTDSDTHKALELYSEASNASHPLAMANKAICLIKRNSSNNDKQIYKDAFKLLILSISLHPTDNKEAYYYLGYLYQNGYHGGKNQPPDEISAFRMYKKAMKRGHINAHTKVGLVLMNGIPNYLEVDEQRAIQLFEMAANSNDEEALNYLGLLLEYGSHSVLPDTEKSIAYYKKSYEKGNSNASFNLATVNQEALSKSIKTTKILGVETRSSPDIESDQFLYYLNQSASKGNPIALKLKDQIITENKSLISTISQRLARKNDLKY